MQIETYKIEEVTGQLDEMAADGEANELIEILGLVGQKKLIDTKTSTRVAFRRMTEVEKDVYELLFPEKSDVLKFDTEIIPVRVLEILRDAKDLNQFITFEVWHSRTKKEDPILVGIAGERQPQTWNQNYISVSARFLIARWGDALLPFEKLCEQAKRLWVAKEKLAATEAIQDGQKKLANVELEADKKFSIV